MAEPGHVSQYILFGSISPTFPTPPRYTQGQKEPTFSTTIDIDKGHDGVLVFDPSPRVQMIESICHDLPRMVETGDHEPEMDVIEFVTGHREYPLVLDVVLLERAVRHGGAGLDRA